VPKAFGNYEYINELLREYNEVVDELCFENSIGVMAPDFYALFQANPDQMYDDLHPNGIGYQSIAQYWRDAIVNSVALRKRKRKNTILFEGGEDEVNRGQF
jgi:lysophospholipase L1-like esterase